VALAQARLDAARAQLAQLNPDPRPSQRVSAAAGVEQAQVALAQAQLNREFAELRAPFAGTVRRLNLELGEMATPGMPVLALLDLSALRFEVAVADVDIGRVALGQAARVQLDALEGAELTGTVSYVAPSSERQGNVQTFLVRVELPNDPRLRTGMSGRLFIE
jgi:HlyD family secretion protein